MFMALHQGYLRGARVRGARVVVRRRCHAIEHKSEAMVVTNAGGNFAAPVIVNAAGAWADVVAGMAGVRPLGPGASAAPLHGSGARRPQLA